MSIIAGDCHAYEKPDDSQLIANYPVFYAALRDLQKRGSSVCFGKHGCCIWQEGAFS